MGPEHARVFAEAGWDRDRIMFELHMRLTTPIDELARGAGGIDEGVPVTSAGGFLAPDMSDGPTSLPKFRPDGLMLAYAGGGAGLFSIDHRRMGQRREGLAARHPGSAILT